VYFELRNVNFLESDAWLEADIIFTSSLCFSDVLINQLLHQAKRLKKGARLITSKLPDRYERWFELTKSTCLSLTCGDVEFFILIRKE
jgi:hypothetical protein